VTYGGDGLVDNNNALTSMASALKQIFYSEKGCGNTLDEDSNISMGFSISYL
jgi:hypothetical protein